jgi:hypothetical protein
MGRTLVIALEHDFPEQSLVLLEAFWVCNFPCTENSGHWPASKPDHLKVVSPLGLFASSSSREGSLRWKPHAVGVGAL